MTLKVFNSVIVASTAERIELGQDEVGRIQVRAYVATTSKVKAAAAFGMSLYEFNQYASEGADNKMADIARDHPDRVVLAPLDHPGGRYLIR